jgi:hypothetical protein
MPGEAIRVSFARAQQDLARANTVRSGPGCLVRGGSGGTSVTVPRRAADLSEASPFSFRCRMEGDQVKVWKGYRKLLGADPVLCAPDSGDEFSFDWVEGNFIWTVFTFSTVATPGAFDETLQTGSAPPSSNATQEVVIVAAMIKDRGWADVWQRHFGDIVIEDQLVCVDCPAS